MKIQIELQRPRWLVAPRTWRARAALSLLALVVLTVPPALATDRFADVPGSNPHHDDISRIAAAGITQGCNPPVNNQYCPDHAVRRDQMASFLQRGLGRAGRAVVGAPVTTTESTAATVTLTVPGSGFVLVTAAADIQCTCIVAMRLRDQTSAEASLYNGQRGTGSDSGTVTQTYLFPVTAGVRSFEVRALTLGGTATIFASATALWVPFGSTGSTTLSTPNVKAPTTATGSINK